MRGAGWLLAGLATGDSSEDCFCIPSESTSLRRPGVVLATVGCESWEELEEGDLSHSVTADLEKFCSLEACRSYDARISLLLCRGLGVSGTAEGVVECTVTAGSLV